MNVLVLGGSGFIGRHVVGALLREGHRVSIGTRNARRTRRRKNTPPQCDLLSLRLERLTEPTAWQPVLIGFDAVVNCVGILRERGTESYEALHADAPLALAQACVTQGVRRLVHISALGLHANAGSRFIRSKLLGDHALLDHADHVVDANRFGLSIVRPSLLDSDPQDCGFGSRWLRRVARWPLHFVPADANGRIAPLHCADLGDAVAALLALPPVQMPRIAELGGADTRTMAEHLDALRRALAPQAAPAVLVRVPGWMARALSHVCDLLHVTPFSFGHLELMRRDNVPRENLLVSLIKRAPRWVGVRASTTQVDWTRRPAL